MPPLALLLGGGRKRERKDRENGERGGSVRGQSDKSQSNGSVGRRPSASDSRGDYGDNAAPARPVGAHDFMKRSSSRS